MHYEHFPNCNVFEESLLHSSVTAFCDLSKIFINTPILFIPIFSSNRSSTIRFQARLPSLWRPVLLIPIISSNRSSIIRFQARLPSLWRPVLFLPIISCNRNSTIRFQTRLPSLWRHSMSFQMAGCGFLLYCNKLQNFSMLLLVLAWSSVFQSKTF